jgi:hypothetical protein
MPHSDRRETVDFDQETTPTRGIRTTDPQYADLRATATVHPGGQPDRDLWRKMTEWLACRQVHPDSRLRFYRGVRNQEEPIIGAQCGQVSIPSSEDGAMHGDPESRGVGRCLRWRLWRDNHARLAIR